MCGRYVMALRAGELADALDAEIPAPEQLRTSYNIAPTSTVPILVERYLEHGAGSGTGFGAGSGAGAGTSGTDPTVRQVHPARWGLLPRWASDTRFSAKTFNARCETAATTPSFRAAVRRRRCAVPAQGYYEWQVEQDPETGKTRRRPFYITPADGSLMLFAGLYEWWQDPQLREAGDPAPWILSTTILTGAAPDEHPVEHPDEPALSALSRLHDRMPLVLTRQTLDRWLEPEAWDGAGAETALAGLRPAAVDDARQWNLREVDAAVGNVAHDAPELAAPVSRLF